MRLCSARGRVSATSSIHLSNLFLSFIVTVMLEIGTHFVRKETLNDVEVIISPFPRTFRNRSIRSKSVKPRSGLFRPEYGLTVVAYSV